MITILEHGKKKFLKFGGLHEGLKFFIVLILAIILSWLYILKSGSNDFLIKERGSSNEPILVYGEIYPDNFRGDDVLKYKPIPYTYSHKALMKYLWKSPNQVEEKYKAWLFLLVTIQIVAFYLFFFYISSAFITSLALSIATVIGYFEHWWFFSFIGVTGYDSLVGRANFTALIPLYLLLYLRTLKFTYGPAVFFFLLGVGVNIYPSIAILSAPIFYLTLIAQKKNDLTIVRCLIPVVFFLAASAPFIYFSYVDIYAFKEAHLSDPAHYLFLDHIKLVLEGYSSSHVENDWSGLFKHPQGSITGIFRHFLFYPPFLIILGFVLIAAKRVNTYEESINRREAIQILTQLFIGSTIFLILGWLMKGLNFEIATILPPHYIGNFLILVGYGLIAYSISKFNLIFTNIYIRLWPAILVFLSFGVLTIIGYFFSGTSSFFSDSFYWVSFNALVIVFLIKKYGYIPIKYFQLMAVLALASGFSYSYEEIGTPLTIYKYFSRAFPIAFSCLFVIFLIIHFKNNLKKLSALVLILVIPFSWGFPLRVYNNVSAFIGNDYSLKMKSRISDFKEMALWVNSNTPPDSRFMIASSRDKSGLVSAFKYIAIRSTPLIEGGDYYFYGNLGRMYAARNSDLYSKAIQLFDDIQIEKLAKEINFDYFIVDIAETNYSTTYFPLVYSNKDYAVYRIDHF